MRQRKSLESKVTKLEKRLGLLGPPPIPPEVKRGYTYIHRDGESEEEIDEKIKKQKAELVEKYGRRILKDLRFYVVHIVGRKHPMAEVSGTSGGAPGEAATLGK
jgi:hypothetical protein